MTEEHLRLLALVEPLRERGWVFVPSTVAVPTRRGITEALLGSRTSTDYQDTVQLWDRWATASRIRRRPADGAEILVWHDAGRIAAVVEGLRTLG